MKKVVLCTLVAASLISGCQKRNNPAGTEGYKFANIQGPTVDQELAFFRDRVEKNPKSAINQAALGGAYLAKAQFSGDASFFELAEKCAQESLKILPIHNAGAKIILASVNEARHEFGKAYEQAREIYATEPTNVDAESIMSSSALELGRLDESLKMSQAVAKEFPTSGALMQVARVKMNMGKDEESHALLLKALSIEQAGDRKVSARIRSLLGEIELRQGHPKEADKYFHAALEAQKTHFPALLGLARLEERAGHPAEAIAWYTQAFQFTQNPAFLTEVGHLKGKGGDTAGAEELRKKAESLLRPEIEKGRFGHARDLARILLDRGGEANFKEAIAILEKESLQRSDVKLWELLGEAYQDGGQLDKANAALKKALSTGLREPALWARLAKVDELQGHAEEARKDMDQARAIDPNFQPAWVER